MHDASAKTEIFNAMREDRRRAARQLDKLAGQGDADAPFLVALRKWNGRTRAGQETAYDAFRRAAERGHAYARLYLAHAKLDGCGTTRNRTVALRWFEQAAADGCAAAMDTLAELYLEDDPALRDIPKGLVWLERAATQQHGTAVVDIRPVHEYDSYPGYIAAREGFRILRAKEHLAFLYDAGECGLARDPGAAAALLEPVYRAGVSDHGWTLHELYEAAALPHDAQRILEQLAHAGDVVAQQKLGWLRPRPDGTVRNLAALLEHGSEDDKLRYALSRLEHGDPRACIRILERPDMGWYLPAEELRKRLQRELGEAGYRALATPTEEPRLRAVLLARPDM